MVMKKTTFFLFGIFLSIGMLITSCNKDEKDDTDIDDVQLNIPKEGLMAYFPFDGDAKDKSGKNVATLVSGATLTTDRNGKANAAYNFNGSSYISILNPAQFNNMTQFTIAAWVCPSALGVKQYILSKADPGRDFALRLTDQDKVNWHFQPLGMPMQQVSSEGGLVMSGQWVHCMAMWTGTSMRIYVDGFLEDEVMVSGASIPWTGDEMQIGAIAGGEKFNGKIDEVLIYNRLLSDLEIAMLLMPANK